MSFLDRSEKVTLVPVKKLKHYGKNRNIHSKDQIDRLVKLITAHGFRDPLIVDKKTMEVICGNGTLMAIKQMGQKDAPCLLQKFDSEEQRYAFSVSHNAIGAWSDLDFPGINADLGDLGPDFDLDSLGIKNFTVDVSEKTGAVELGEKDFSEFDHTCPKCGFEYDNTP